MMSTPILQLSDMAESIVSDLGGSGDSVSTGGTNAIETLFSSYNELLGLAIIVILVSIVFKVLLGMLDKSMSTDRAIGQSAVVLQKLQSIHDSDSDEDNDSTLENKASVDGTSDISSDGKKTHISEDAKSTMISLSIRRDDAVKEINDLIVQRGLYELDPAFCIDNPSFLDLNAAHMISLARAQKNAMRTMNNLSLIDEKDLVINDVKELESAVDDFSHALDAAVSTSQAIGWGKISRSEKKLLSRAQNLLSMALNEAASDNERMLSLKKLEDTIIEVRETYGYAINVEKIMLAVTQKTKMMITA